VGTLVWVGGCLWARFLVSPSNKSARLFGINILFLKIIFDFVNSLHS